MSFTDRRDFYVVESVGKADELDYLSSKLNDITLPTVEHHRVDQVTAHRPDLISLKYYGTYHLGWLIAQHNDMLDPVEDMSIGRLIKIPSVVDYYQYYNRKSVKAR